MSEPFVGEIKMFAGNFAPRSWALCDGQLLAVAQNDALFSLLGTIYGGDGRTTFGLPDLRGRVPIHAGSGPGLSQRNLGAKSGTEKVTLTTNELPSHKHGNLQASENGATTVGPQANVTGEATKRFYRSDTSGAMNSKAVTAVGGGQSHTNLMPTLCVNFIIALYGIYPSRS
jgi:microcystin-dependent protein